VRANTTVELAAYVAIEAENAKIIRKFEKEDVAE